MHTEYYLIFCQYESRDQGQIHTLQFIFVVSHLPRLIDLKQHIEPELPAHRRFVGITGITQIDKAYAEGNAQQVRKVINIQAEQA